MYGLQGSSGDPSPCRDSTLLSRSGASTTATGLVQLVRPIIPLECSLKLKSGQTPSISTRPQRRSPPFVKVLPTASREIQSRLNSAWPAHQKRSLIFVLQTWHVFVSRASTSKVGMDLILALGQFRLD